MIDIVKIGTNEEDLKSYNVIVTSIKESFNILYSENTGRTMSTGARMTLDPLGTFYGYEISFKRKNGYEQEFDSLFDFVSKPRPDGIKINVVHNQSLWVDQNGNEKPFDAYVSQGSRGIKRIDEKTNKVYWDEFSINVIPMEAQVLP